MKLYLFQLGLLQPVSNPIPGHLIPTYDHHNVMVDSELPYKFISNPLGPMGPLRLQVEIQPEEHIVNRLVTIGLKPADIDYLVGTHFDVDHAGNHELFSNAQVIIQLEHYEATIDGHARS